MPLSTEVEDVLLACRFGDLGDIRAFVDTHGRDALANARDDQCNSPLHMAAANGHDDVLRYLLPIFPASLSAVQNDSQSTPLHWAVVNKHLTTIKLLIEPPPPSSTITSLPTTGAPPPPTPLSLIRTDLIDIRNAAGRTPLVEAELAAWDEGAAYLVSVMTLDHQEQGKTTGGPKEQEADEEIGLDEDADSHIEVEDAEGKISKISIRAEEAPTTSA
ncbi:uncharacterized protein EI90DRAFT_2919006 [Cantharellus anzutake]|uniref:uncharacterized protein n=1 Tax=Cantharellus anzutake TaxID=1750568 RepID=UPI00190717BB|nr:uncharacterized protein EI90DRAFT_2919006 [Cantharellus anzutake]KAF8332113.1 hypothetical protein EI90DRAFT_2919006 [Cantharellus anzutake]